jgi:GTP cyclohydrolase IA
MGSDSLAPSFTNGVGAKPIFEATGGASMENPAARGNEPDNVIEIGSAMAHAVPEPRTGWFELPGRTILPEDWARYRESVTEIFEAFGMDLDTPGTSDTPERFLRALFEATSGYDGDPKLATTFPAETTIASAGVSQVIEGPIEFHCLCEHHALPFFGVAYVGYIAGERIIGISKLTRLLWLFARRFTVQERLGEQIADGLLSLIEPRGVAVHLEASHLCTQMRGVEEQSRTATTFWRGEYDDHELRREFLLEIRGARSR